ncbi:hypothetical protein, partial [Mycolicibacterium fortuitum]|uniref:hypothetical protein n=1 Tax=Mycolicibacterium fortuitum TaxID=1766 RepID=UPI001CDD23E3
FPFDLHVLSTPPAFVLSQDQTLQTKTPGQTRQNSNQKNPITNKRHQTNWHQKNKQPHPKREKERGQNNKQKPPNTLLSSQTTGFSALSPCFGATPPA